MPTGGTYHAEYDSAGRMSTLRQGDRLRLRQQWRSDGQPALLASETSALRPEYCADGVQMGLLITAPESGSRVSQWLHYAYDDLGRIARLTDAAGTDVRLTYDQTGEPVVLASQRGSVQLGHDTQGRVETVRTSWGERQDNAYDPQSGTLTRAVFTQGNQHTVLDFGPWGLHKVQHFDGGELRLAYYDQGRQQGQIKALHAPHGPVLRYAYDPENRLTAIDYGAACRLTYTYDAQGRVVRMDHGPAKP